MTLLVTGGAGFIGFNFIETQRRENNTRIINLDKLGYAANPMALKAFPQDPDYVFVQGDIGDKDLIAGLLKEHRPSAIVNFAAESHVDRSILGPAAFVETNVVGTCNMLEVTLAHWRELPEPEQTAFRFLHVSTDEVYGTLGPDDPAFSETTPFAPNSPYAASKAASDHFVRAYHHTYGLPVLTTNCSNNYGPYQFPEKLIPLIINNALEGQSLPIYGDGLQVRDWLYVQDHCHAIDTVLKQGRLGETYNIGGRCQSTNIDVVKTICSLLDELVPDSPYRPHENLISYVKDRPGHDRRYAIDDGKIRSELGWEPRETFETGLRKTVQWYLDQEAWLEMVRTDDYQAWVGANYQNRPSETPKS